ncbi:unnamed protein product, partial [Prunus brigantina]
MRWKIGNRLTFLAKALVSRHGISTDPRVRGMTQPKVLKSYQSSYRTSILFSLLFSLAFGTWALVLTEIGQASYRMITF